MNEYVPVVLPSESKAFNRWLNGVIADALEVAADEVQSRRNEPGIVQLDVRYGGYYTGIRSGMESAETALRARAKTIREGKTA